MTRSKTQDPVGGAKDRGMNAEPAPTTAPDVERLNAFKWNTASPNDGPELDRNLLPEVLRGNLGHGGRRRDRREGVIRWQAQ